MPLHGAAGEKLVAGRSVQGRPIDAWHFGSSPVSLFIFGGIHGDEPASEYVARKLVERLRNDPGLTQGGVLVLPAANPDGLARLSRHNARGVDLNRNFAARNWKPSGNTHGSTPLSEPETRALVALIERFRPRQIISIHAIRGARQCNCIDGPAEPLARLLAHYNRYPVKPTIGYPTPGSFGSWAGIDCGIAVVTLELPKTADGPVAWETNREGLLAAIAFAAAR